MGIETIIAMIPKGGKYAKSVVNFVHKVPQNWEKFKSAIQQIDDILKQGKLKLDGKQKTIFESNKNILKNHEKVVKVELKDANKFFEDLLPPVTKKYPPFNVSKEDFTKGWTPTLVERSNLRNIYKDKLYPPKEKYTKEMEAIDEELDALAFGGDKYEGLSVAEKAKIFKKLQAEMKQLIAKGEDLSKLSLGQINKKSHALQKRIREIADNPNIKGTVTEGPKADMIDAIYKGESKALSNAQNIINRKNVELKYGKTFPRLDPENDAFIILGLDSSGNPIKVSRFTGHFGATKNPITGELSRKEGTSFYDKWDTKKNQLRKEGEEVWHETVDREGKVIMSNPDYKIPKTELMDLQTELYTNLSMSDLAKKGYKLKNIDMIMKGREVRKYLEAQEATEKGLDTGIKMHERTNTNEITDIMEDLYFKGDDVYKMSIEEWTKKIPEYFAEGGRTGFHRGSLRHQKEHDYQAYEKEGNLMKYLKLSGDRAKMSSPEHWINRLVNPNMKVLQKRDDFETWQKERFMYGEHIPPNVFKKIWADIQKLLDKQRNEHATGGVSNLFQERQGYRSGEAVIKLAKGARWLIRMLKEMSDDMIFGRAQFAKMVESVKMKYFQETQAAIKQP